MSTLRMLTPIRASSLRFCSKFVGERVIVTRQVFATLAGIVCHLFVALAWQAPASSGISKSRMSTDR